MPGGRNKSIGPVQVSVSDCFSTVPFSFCSLGLGTQLLSQRWARTAGAAQRGMGLGFI